MPSSSLAKHLTELTALKARLAALQNEIGADAATLATLPETYGFANVEDFVRAVRAASRQTMPRRPRAPRRRPAVTAAPAPSAPAPSAPAATAPAAPALTAAPAPVPPPAPAVPPPPPAPAFPTPPDILPPRAADASAATYHAQLVGELERTGAALKTVGIPPALWAQWRAYESRVRTALTALAEEL